MYDLVAVTGAGISKASGVPTFEEMGDLREKLSRGYFEGHPNEFYDVLLTMKKNIDNAIPNPAHSALVEYKIPVITMNIDGLHGMAGSENVLEVHGNLKHVLCNKCDKIYDFDIIRESICCPQCNELLQPNVVLYGDSIRNYYDAINLIGSSKQVLVVGTSFYTSTVNDFVNSAKNAGIKVSVINQNAEEEVKKFLKSQLIKLN